MKTVVTPIATTTTPPAALTALSFVMVISLFAFGTMIAALTFG